MSRYATCLFRQSCRRALVAVKDANLRDGMFGKAADAQPFELSQRLPAQKAAAQRIPGFTGALDHLRRNASPCQRNRCRTACRARAQN